MKTLITAALPALLILASFSTVSHGQGSPHGANAPKYQIAVVDVSFIFKKHASFRAKMDGMKGEMQTIEQQLEAERKKIVAKEEEKNRFNPGTAEFSAADDELSIMKAQFQLNMQRLRKGFLEKEAKVYYETYQEVSKAIKYYAEQKNIGLVLRFNGEPADPAKRESIIAVINKPVQFQNKLDITPDILTMLNRGAPTPPPVQEVGGRGQPNRNY